jgi:hypothetical protein
VFGRLDNVRLVNEVDGEKNVPILTTQDFIQICETQLSLQLSTTQQRELFKDLNAFNNVIRLDTLIRSLESL